MHIGGFAGQIRQDLCPNFFGYPSNFLSNHQPPHPTSLLYEEKGFLCTNCGFLGHIKTACSYPFKHNQPDNTGEESTTTTNLPSSMEDTTMGSHANEWQTVYFTKKKKQMQRNQQPSSKETPIVKVKTFDKVSGMFLNPPLPESASGKPTNHSTFGPSPTGLA